MHTKSLEDCAPDIADFPMNVRVLSSVFCARNLATVLVDAYGFSCPVTCELLAHGFNDIYRVRADGGTYFLKLYASSLTSRRDIESEIRILLHLKSCRFSTSRPIALRTGAHCLCLNAPEGERFAILFSEAPGQPLHKHLNESSCEAVGRFVATMHDHLDELQANAPIRQSLEVHTMLRSMESALTEEQKTRLPLLASWMDGLLQLVRSSTSDHAPFRGICHGDILDRNIYVGRDGLTILDFELAHHGPRAYDLATFLSSLATRKRLFPASIRIEDSDMNGVWRAFLEGYGQVRPLESAEQRAVHALVPVRRVLELGAMAEYAQLAGLRCFPATDFDRGFAFIRHWIDAYRLL